MGQNMNSFRGQKINYISAPPVGSIARLLTFALSAFVLLALALPQTAGADAAATPPAGGGNVGATSEDEVTAEWYLGIRLNLYPSSSVSEDGGRQKVTVEAKTSFLGMPLGNDFTYEVTVGKSGDSAVAGVDYKAVSKFWINIKSGNTAGRTSFYLEPLGDNVWEGDEAITIRAAGPSSATATLTLTDEGDRPYTGPKVKLSVNPSSVNEADGSTTVTVTASSGAQSVHRRVKVAVGSTGSTAVKGTDYRLVQNFADIHFPANATSATRTFTLTPIQDTAEEGDETIAITGQIDDHDGGLIGTTLTLTDDDEVPLALSVNPTSVTEDGGAQTVTVTATAKTAFTYARTTLVGVGNSKEDTATPGTDYPLVPWFDVTVPANATTGTGTFIITPTNDTLVEDTETISVNGTQKSGGEVVAVGGTSMTLTDDEDLPALTLSANPSSVGEGAGPTSVTVTATAASAVAWERSVKVVVGPGSTATWGTDYVRVPDIRFAIPANATTGTGTFTLTPIQDTVNEGDETIGLAGTSPRTTVTGATMTLADDDINPPVTLSASPSSVGEGASATSVTVTATATSAMTSARTVTVAVGSSTDGATEGTDYATVADFTISIAANATTGTGTFTLTPTQDTAVEGGETIGVTGASPATQVTGTSVTLADDDNYPAVTLSASPSSVGEDASATSVTVTATTTSSVATARTVTVSVGQTGTATAGTDYEAVDDFTITIAANATTGTGTFTLTPTEDALFEDDETIGVDGSSPSTTMTGTTLTLTDDTKAAVTLSLSPSSVGEEASATSVTVTATLSGKNTFPDDKVVTISVGDSGTATSGTDYEAVTDFNLTIPANLKSGTATFTFTPKDDSVIEGRERLSVAGTGTDLDVDGTTLTLTETDTADLRIDVVGRVREGDTKKQVQVFIETTNNNTFANKVTCHIWNLQAGATATWDDDYLLYSFVGQGLVSPGTKISDTIPINIGYTYYSFFLPVTAKTDNLVEGDEKITIGATCTSPGVADIDVYSGSLIIEDADSLISLAANPSSVAEDAGATTVTVTASLPGTNQAPSDMQVDIKVGKSGDSAVFGTDYDPVDDFTITIPKDSNSATGTFTLTPTHEKLVEWDETLTVSGTRSKTSVTDATVTIADDDVAPFTLSAAPSSVSEGASATEVTVTATNRWVLRWPATVTVSVGDSGTATSGTDYAAVADFDISIAKGEKTGTGTFTLTPTQDTTWEGDETIGLAGNGTDLTIIGTNITLTEDDPRPITLSAAPSSVSEGASATSVTVTATATASDTARTVTVSVGDTGTATSGTDYAAVTDFDITIAANATTGTGTFTLTPTQDTAVEGSETIGVAGSATGSSVTGTAVTLTDDDSAPGVTLSASPSTVGEQSPAASVTVTATTTSSVSFARTVTVSVGGTGTATSGTDYAAVSDFTITINANATTGTGTFTLTPTQDAASEGDETIGVSGTSANTTVTGTTLTLTDDDRPTITLVTVPPNLKVVEDASQSSVTVRATLAAPVKAETTVTLTVGASGDGATKDTDYKASNIGKIKILKGQARGEAGFDLTPVQDTLVEGDESISVSGSSSGSHSVNGTSLTLTDDDEHPALTLSATPASVGEGASATSVTVTATAKTAMSSARTVTVSVGGSGTATSGTDYAAVSDFTITMAANSKTGTGTFTLTPTQDTTVEGSETIGVAGTSTLSTVTGTTVTLTDDDSYPALTLSTSPSSVSEGASATSVTVTATAASAISSARTVTVSVGDSGTADAGVDYATVADFTLTINANATTGTGTFTLTPTQDTAVEGNETIGVAGASASSTVTGTTLTLADDDSHGITLSASPSTVAEDKSSETITVTATLNVARTTATTVTVSVGDSSDAATSGTDYKAVSDFTITIAANATKGTGTFDFEPLTDEAYEGFESVTISGTAAEQEAGGASDGASAANTPADDIPVTDTSLSIHDASNYPSVTLTASPTSVGEGASATSVTVTATATSAIASSREVTVSVGDSGTATSGTDYAAVDDFIITIAANKKSATGTFTLTPTQDTVVEGNETVGVSATSLSTTVTGTTVTLTDDDTAPAVNLSLSPSSMGEGASGTQVTVSAAFSNTNTYADDQTVTVSVGDTGTATSGTDYAAVTDFDLTITKGQTSGTATFTLTPTQDTLVEGSETIGVAGSATGLTVNGADLTLTDDDTAPAVNLSLKPVQRERGRVRDIGDGNRGVLQHQHLRRGPDRDCLGGRQRHGDFRHGLRGGVELRHHDYQGDYQRHGHVHVDPDARHPGRRQRDHRRGRQRHGPDRERRGPDADRRRRRAGGEPEPEPVECERRRVRDIGNGDRGVLQHQHVH